MLHVHRTVSTELVGCVLLIGNTLFYTFILFIRPSEARGCSKNVVFVKSSNYLPTFFFLNEVKAIFL